MKIVTILGARPQFIKASSVSREIMRQRDTGLNIQEVIVHTGQHYDANMSDIFFEEMQIPIPNYYLGVGGKRSGALTGQMIEKIEKVLTIEKPDWVMLYGDTDSTLAGAIAASKLHIKIAHVEAGLRSFNINMPEEINRILTDRISSVLFCPTQTAVMNLCNEGVKNWRNDPKLLLVGDVMLDGAMFYQSLAKMPKDSEVQKSFVLCTIHRAENTDNPKRLSQIIFSLNEIAKNQQVILPLHPRTKNFLLTSDYDISNLTIIEPQGYLNMVWLLKHCTLVMTDSGGLQKEAYFFAKPCITMRDETEWVELVEAGINVLVGADKFNILSAYKHSGTLFKKDAFGKNFYGTGQTSELIVSFLTSSNNR